MSVTWTPVPIPNVTIELLTETNTPLLTEDGLTILVSRGDVWTGETVPTDIWTPVTGSGSWTKING